MSEEQISPRGHSPGLRASDEDREQLIAELNEHAVAGRLSTEELEERLQAAYAARTTGELDALRRDLPVTDRQAAIAHAARRAQLSRRLVQETGGSLTAFVVCTAIWLATGAHGQFWPVWVLIAVVATLARSAWALYGPSPDLDSVEEQLDARRAHRE
ncbi:MAG TPA: DUF1707 domain-containing protein, partial [Solirubrobacteraceae bacterium]|nr:DUF1707 domain-containing protein [Solirubrobacteraceae bacterium]